jgi:hypothetical protein
MRVTRKSRLEVLVQNVVFTLALLALTGLLAWLSTQYIYQADWTHGHRNSLSPASVQLLKSLDQAPQFTVYAGDKGALRDNIRKYLSNYRLARPDIVLSFVDTERDPEVARAAGITADGELVIGYHGRSEKITQYTEYEISNAIQRLARSAERYVVFLSGDGERDPHGQHNFDLGDFGKQLESKGFKLETLNLAANPGIPDNTAVLVIAGPQAKLLAGAPGLIRDYLKRGGNLLWLGDPGPLYGLEPVAQDLGVSFGAGTIVDPESQLFGISDAAVLVVPKYESTSPITRDFSTTTVYAGATSVEPTQDSRWQAQEFLKTLPKSWLATGKLKGTVTYDPKHGDKLGPLSIGVALTRPAPAAAESGKTAASPEQRVVVTGDGDFLSDAYLNNGGNLGLGLNIVDWLAHEDSSINLNVQLAPDLTLDMSPRTDVLLGAGFLLGLPLLLLLTGFVVWVRRRRR